MPAPTGATTTLSYRWEDEGFGAEPTANDPKPWGANATLDTAEGSNEAVRVLQPSSRKAAEVIKTVFSGSWTVSFTLTNPWWLRAVLGEPESTGSETTTHTYDGELTSTRIYQGRETGSNTRELYGCVAANATIDATVPNVVTVNISGAYAGEEIDTGAVDPQPALEFPALRFSEASVGLEDGDLGIVQNAQLTIATNAEMVNALDSDEAVDYYVPTIEPTVSYERVRDDTTDTLEDFYGGTQTAGNEPGVGEFTLTLDSVKAENEITFTMESALADTYSTSNSEDPNELSTEEVNRNAIGVIAEAVNETEEAP